MKFSDYYKLTPQYLLNMFALGTVIDVKYDVDPYEAVDLEGTKVKQYMFIFENVVRIGKILMNSKKFYLPS